MDTGKRECSWIRFPGLLKESEAREVREVFSCFSTENAIGTNESVVIKPKTKLMDGP
jgi:hypothetical protein